MRGGQSFLHFVLRNKTGHLNCEIFIKTFLKQDQDRLNWKFFRENKTTLSITASGNILASGNISLKLFIAPLETMKLLNFWYVVTLRNYRSFPTFSSQ